MTTYRAGKSLTLPQTSSPSDEKTSDVKTALLTILDNLLNGQKSDFMSARAFVNELDIGRLALSADYDNGGKVSSKSEYVQEVDNLLKEVTQTNDSMNLSVFSSSVGNDGDGPSTAVSEHSDMSSFEKRQLNAVEIDLQQNNHHSLDFESDGEDKPIEPINRGLIRGSSQSRIPVLMGR